MSSDSSSSVQFHFPDCPTEMDSETSFFMAIKKNNVSIVEKLLSSKSVDVDHKFAPENKPAIFLAVESGHREMVECLIRYGCSVNQSDRRGETPLHQAVRDRRNDLIEILLKERAKALVLNNYKWSPLNLAVYSRSVDIVKTLVGHDSTSPSNSVSEYDLNVMFGYGRTGIFSPFSQACSMGFDEIVVFFLSFLNKKSARKLFVIRRRTTDTTNPFLYIPRLKEETLELIVDTLPMEMFMVGISDDSLRRTPLHLLAQNKDMPLAKTRRMANLLLTRARAPTDIRDLNGQTPLLVAIVHKNEAVIEPLLRAGCRTDISDHSGVSPLRCAVLACTYNLESSWIVEKLLAFGVNLEHEEWISMMLSYKEHWHAGNLLLPALANLRNSMTLNSLQRLCRNVIRGHLKHRADEAIEKLDCLPKGLKMFLLVEKEPQVLHF